jgi:acetoacetyl-CoA reductase
MLERNLSSKRQLSCAYRLHWGGLIFSPFPNFSNTSMAWQRNSLVERFGLRQGHLERDETTLGARKLDQKIAVVTGGTRGIGRAICESLRDNGMTVVANYAGNAQKAQSFTDETGIPAYQFDVGVHEDALAGCAKIADDIGPIDVLVNNAGITRDGTLMKMSYADWDDVMRVNLGGCFNMAKACFEGMKTRRFGRIVNIGSINGQAGQYGQVNYAAAKSGIHGFTKALAQEGARFGITVNAIAPGYIDTDMVAAVPEPVLEKIVAKIPVGRLGHADEIARAVNFLCSEDAAFVTGSTMSVNGGQHMY